MVPKNRDFLDMINAQNLKEPPLFFFNAVISRTRIGIKGFYAIIYFSNTEGNIQQIENLRIINILRAGIQKIS